MNLKNTKKAFAFVVLVTLLGLAHSHAATVPALTGRVNDYANEFLPHQREALESRLAQIEKETTNQIVVLTVSSLDGQTVDDFANVVFSTWKLGQKGKDNGVLIVQAKTERKITIRTGYGLEPVLTDAVCAQIIRANMTPHFKGGRFSEGFNEAVDQIEKAAKGEFQSDASKVEDVKESLGKIVYVLVAAVIAGVIGCGLWWLGGLAGAAGGFFYCALFPGSMAVIAAIFLGALIALFVTLVLRIMASGGGGGYGGYSDSGSSWISGGGGGGFSGGGGDTGGGGASGDY